MRLYPRVFHVLRRSQLSRMEEAEMLHVTVIMLQGLLSIAQRKQLRNIEPLEEGGTNRDPPCPVSRRALVRRLGLSKATDITQEKSRAHTGALGDICGTRPARGGILDGRAGRNEGGIFSQKRTSPAPRAKKLLSGTRRCVVVIGRAGAEIGPGHATARVPGERPLLVRLTGRPRWPPPRGIGPVPSARAAGAHPPRRSR
ncbi:hypothetical protein MTO96_010345 [Rhipicephalus appendiculatus]